MTLLEVSERDASEILADAHALAYPRYPGTEGDRKAIAWVAAKLRDAGLEVAIEEFSYDVRPAFRALTTIMLGLAALLLTSAFLAVRSPVLSIALLTLGLGAGAFLLSWSPWSERIYAGDGPTRTANVAGYRRVKKPLCTIILLAHHDSKSQNLTFPWRIGMTLLALLAALVLAALLVAGVVGGELPGPSGLAPAIGLVAAAALAVLSTLRSGNKSPGGVDNAGSLAIVLKLAHLLPTVSGPRVDDVEWIFLSPGAEEDHMVGAMRWLDRHRDELAGRPVWALNFDGAGNPGVIALLERFGFGRPFSPDLSRVARRCAATRGLKVRGVLMPPAMGIDSIPFHHRGLDCLTFATGSLGRATLAIHSARDVADNLDLDAILRVTRLAGDVALAMAGGEGDAV